jgi:hypothetical protein
MLPMKSDHNKHLIPFAMITSERPKSKYYPIPKFWQFWYGKKTTDTDTERCCIPIPKPVRKPIPKDENCYVNKFEYF